MSEVSSSNPMNAQHFRVKLFAETGSNPDLHQAIPVFHRWIREKRMPETAVDVSDYLHVPGGPGIILVCHEAIYGLDLEKNKLGLIYNRRTALEGTNEQRLQQAVASVNTAAEWLENEPEFAGKLKFDRSHWEVVVNDRVLAPNVPATFVALAPSIASVFDGILGPGKYQAAYQPAPGELFRTAITAG